MHNRVKSLKSASMSTNVAYGFECFGQTPWISVAAIRGYYFSRQVRGGTLDFQSAFRFLVRLTVKTVAPKFRFSLAFPRERQRRAEKFLASSRDSSSKDQRRVNPHLVLPPRRFLKIPPTNWDSASLLFERSRLVVLSRLLLQFTAVRGFAVWAVI